jgi:hypothetical protein
LPEIDIHIQGKGVLDADKGEQQNNYNFLYFHQNGDLADLRGAKKIDELKFIISLFLSIFFAAHSLRASHQYPKIRTTRRSSLQKRPTPSARQRPLTPHGGRCSVAADSRGKAAFVSKKRRLRRLNLGSATASHPYPSFL